MAEEAMAAHGWSSLPADLVNRIADCLLATNDLDCYNDLRAVCHHWRSVTADPMSNQLDPRFRPRRWVMLDEHKACAAAANTVDDGALLFVNTATGRFLRRSLALLRDPGHAFVTSTTDGLIVLAARESPHALSVLNPFTGSLVRFSAQLPSQPRPGRLRLTADVVVGPSPAALVLVSVGQTWVYSAAEPQTESFSVDKSHNYCPASRLPLIVATAAAGNREASVPAGAENIFDQIKSMEEYGDEDCRIFYCRFYAMVAPGGDLLGVLKRRDGIDVFKIDAARNVMERVRSIGSLALFLGVRCLVVDTDCFPATVVQPNCAYFLMTDRRYGQRYIYKFSIGFCGKPELVSAAMGNTNPCSMGPFTVTQLFCNYTMDIPAPWKGCSSYLELEGWFSDGHYEAYIDYCHVEYGEDSSSGYDHYSTDDDDCY